MVDVLLAGRRGDDLQAFLLGERHNFFRTQPGQALVFPGIARPALEGADEAPHVVGAKGVHQPVTDNVLQKTQDEAALLHRRFRHAPLNVIEVVKGGEGQCARFNRVVDAEGRIAEGIQMRRNRFRWSGWWRRRRWLAGGVHRPLLPDGCGADRDGACWRGHDLNGGGGLFQGWCGDGGHRVRGNRTDDNRRRDQRGRDGNAPGLLTCEELVDGVQSELLVGFGCGGNGVAARELDDEVAGHGRSRGGKILETGKHGESF